MMVKQNDILLNFEIDLNTSIEHSKNSLQRDIETENFLDSIKKLLHESSNVESILSISPEEFYLYVEKTTLNNEFSLQKIKFMF